VFTRASQPSYAAELEERFAYGSVDV